MSTFRTLWIMPTALGAAALTAAAQTAQPPGRKADPLDAAADVPAVIYQSSLGRSRRSMDSKPIGWREANDATERIGGWRAYAKEAQQPEAKAVPMPPAHGADKLP